jgi:protein gp37
MAQNSKIEWTHHTVNPWHGCTAVHSGCDHCYAEVLSKRWGNNVWGNDNPRKEIKSAFNDLAKYQKLAAQANEIHRVFVGSMMDIAEKPMPLINSKGELYKNINTGILREQLFSNINLGLYPNLMFLFLSKRPSNFNKYIPEHWKETPPDNIMFGTSPVDQKTFNDLVGQLIKVKGKKFLSIEPQLDFISVATLGFTGGGISWIIQGGESGPKKRPFNIEWARSMRDECKSLMIPYFFKQIDKVQEIPLDLQVREFPVL